MSAFGVLSLWRPRSDLLTRPLPSPPLSSLHVPPHLATPRPPRPPHSPIHTQRFFLTRPLRAALLASHGVRSFRIHQRPGQAVLVPAGCAHQVMNAADCIKVATDFVSAENVARCWKGASSRLVSSRGAVLCCAVLSRPLLPCSLPWSRSLRRG